MIVIVFFGMVASVAISAFKWKIILTIHSISYSFWKLISYYLTALFFNNFLPSNIGGDAYRIYRVIARQENKAGGVASVIVDRLSGVWALIFLSLLGALWHYFKYGSKPSWILGVIGVFAAGSFLPGLMFTDLRRIFLSIIGRLKYLKKILFISYLYQDYRGHPYKSITVVIVSIAFHLFTLSWMLALSHAVGEPVSAHKIIVGLAVSNLAALIPISLNGIGLLDGSYIYVMVELGMSFNGALMMMLILRALTIVLSLVGGMLFLFDRKRISYAELKGSLG